MVLRRIVFVGAALAQVSSAGVGLAVLAGKDPSLMSLLFTLGGVAAFSVRSRDRRTTQESFIGIGYAVASAIAVLFVARARRARATCSTCSPATCSPSPTRRWAWMAAVAVAAVALHTLFHKQFLFSAFDAETARALGFRVGWWDLFFFLLVGVVVSLGIRLAGTLLVFAFLVIPGVIGLLLSQRLGKIYALAIGSAAIATAGWPRGLA